MAAAPPSSDELRPRSDEPDVAPRPARRRSPDSTTSDEISVLLSSSLDSPEPDPMLGGSSSWDLARAAARQADDPASLTDPTSGLDVGVDLAAPVEPASHREEPGASERPHDWAGLLVRSYASAVTLALGWLLWTGKASPPPAEPAREVPARRRAVEPPPSAVATAAPASPSLRTTGLGRPVVVDGLEVTPLLVLRRGVRAVRSLGEESLVREHDGCLALTVRLKNLSADGERLRPIVAADLVDGDAFAIDAPPGPRVAMFALAPGSGWAVEDQTFPEVGPGEIADVVLLSEPLGDRRLSPGMTWRFRVATDPARERREGLGVTFGPDDIP
ncbi:MAG: hypothetical protein BGO49_11750 [Planctomycetales bacterium 71-10]|nr:MAG: hypothetical protein BGO49_11750 [Planctomycetales bacterium 71-10]